MFDRIFCLCPVDHATQIILYCWPVFILHSSCNLCCISKHHHQLGTGILLFSLWYVCLSYAPSRHSFCEQVCWDSIVLVNARCTSNRDTVPSVCSVCFMVGYITSFLLPMDGPHSVSLLVRENCSIADQSSKRNLIYLHTWCCHKRHRDTALCRHHSPVSREQFYIKSGSKDPS